MPNVKSIEPSEFQDGYFWKLEESGSLLVGATETALAETGELQSVELAEIGEEFDLGDWIGELHGKNGSVEIFAPANVTVQERNLDVIGNCSMVEDDPTGDAWLIRLEVR